jgi:hypothetical protein
MPWITTCYFLPPSLPPCLGFWFKAYIIQAEQLRKLLSVCIGSSINNWMQQDREWVGGDIIIIIIINLIIMIFNDYNYFTFFKMYYFTILGFRLLHIEFSLLAKMSPELCEFVMAFMDWFPGWIFSSNWQVTMWFNSCSLCTWFSRCP